MVNARKMIEECMRVEINGLCIKPLIKSIELLSKKWALMLFLIFPLKNEPLRYKEIYQRINMIKDETISDTTLSLRLKDFVHEGILKKTAYPEIPPKVEYCLTKKGIRLKESIEPLISWAIQECHA